MEEIIMFRKKKGEGGEKGEIQPGNKSNLPGSNPSVGGPRTCTLPPRHTVKREGVTACWYVYLKVVGVTVYRDYYLRP